MDRILSREHNLGLYSVNKMSLSSYDDKNIYVKVDIVGYHIFINLLVNLMKIILPNIENLF